MQRGSCQITTVIVAGLAAFALPALSEESNQDLQGEKRVADEGAGGPEADSNRSIAALETTELEEVKVTGDWLGSPHGRFGQNLSRRPHGDYRTGASPSRHA